MLSLLRKEFPSSKGDVAQALDQALRRFVQKPGPLVDLRSRVFPCIDEIAINIDGARFDSPLPPPAKIEGETNLAFEASMVTLSGRNISVRGIPLDLRLEMRDVVFHKGEDGNGQAVLVLQKARDGHAVISAAQLALEEAIAKIGGREGRRRGIHIEQVRLSMRARGRRSLAADVRVQARKFLFRAKVDIYGQLDINDEFVGKIADLKCKGDGAIGSLACGALEPFFRQLSTKSFPLKSLPLGEIQLRDLHVAVADTVEVTIDFGSPSS